MNVFVKERLFVFMPKNMKWFSLLIPLFYVLIGSVTIIKESEEVYLKLMEFCFNGAIITAIVIYFIKKSEVNTLYKLVVLFSFHVYLFILHHLVTYVPLSYYLHTEYLVSHPAIQFYNLNLIPFKTISDTFFWNLHTFTPVTVIQILGNALLMTPFAFALMFLGIIRNPIKLIIVMCSVSVLIELIQFIETTIGLTARSTDIDDVILNTFSGIIGVWIYYMFKLFSDKKQKFRSLRLKVGR